MQACLHAEDTQALLIQTSLGGPPLNPSMFHFPESEMKAAMKAAMKAPINFSCLSAMKLLLSAVLCLAPIAAGADTMTYVFDNNTQHQIDVKMFARDRNNQWPSMGKAYSLAAGKQGTKLPIECDAGERICVGAWSPHPKGNVLWGAGKTGLNTCENCCSVCTDGKVLKTVKLGRYIGN